MRNIFSLLFLILFFVQASAQKGIQLNTKEATDGYILVETINGTYLVNNCGKYVKKWSVTNADNHSKLLPNGNIMYIENNTIFERDWNDKIVVEVSVEPGDFYLDYEVIKLANGNYLCVGREQITISELQAHGYNIPNTSPSVYDIVLEIDKNNGKVVWRWDILDHVIQDKSSTKKSFGVIKDHPEKLDINAIQTYDWQFTESFMINGMDYNPDLDQIVISVRKVGEAMIIDHSTTTAQAKTGSGGKYGKGGDFLYRYGNPANYGRGTKAQQQLFFQHNPNWIKYGPHKGKIILFNNLLSSKDYSSVEIIETPVQADGSYFLENAKAFTPIKPTVEYNSPATNTVIKSGYTSGAKVLPNGNIFITEGMSATCYEIDKSGKKLFKYLVADAGYLFRSEKYPADYEPFIGKFLQPLGVLEFPVSSYNCSLFNTVDTIEEEDSNKWKIINGTDHLRVIGLNDFDYEIYNINGQLIAKDKSYDSIIYLQKSSHLNMYFVKIKNGNKNAIRKIIY